MRCSYVIPVLGALALTLLPRVALASQKSERKPNVIVIVADDLGYADLGCQGCKDVPTPHIDSLAKHGIRCTSGYVSGAYCSPTRAGLVTGRYQQRFGHEFNPGPAASAPKDAGLPLSETTIANYLRAVGYRTGLIGKWHLGYEPQFHPQQRGFDEYFGFLSGAHSYFNDKKKGNAILRGTTPVKEAEYLTDALGREAVSFIDKHRAKPFFLMLTFNAVHAPMQAPKKYMDRFADIKDSKRQTMAAMLSALDEAIGTVLAKLREFRLEEDTLIFFVSDNGGPTQVNGSRNTPLRGFKAQVWEGGVRVPFLVQWKGRLPGGKVYDHPLIALDILPTALAAAGGTPKEGAKLDGVNLLPYLGGKNDGRPHEVLYWRFGEQWAIRKGDWKLTKVGKGGPELHDLSKDLSQAKDLAAAMPERVKELRAEYEKWNVQLAKPVFLKKQKKIEEAAPDSAAAQAAPTAARPCTALGGHLIDEVSLPFLNVGLQHPLSLRRILERSSPAGLSKPTGWKPSMHQGTEGGSASPPNNFLRSVGGLDSPGSEP